MVLPITVPIYTKTALRKALHLERRTSIWLMSEAYCFLMANKRLFYFCCQDFLKFELIIFLSFFIYFPGVLCFLPSSRQWFDFTSICTATFLWLVSFSSSNCFLLYSEKKRIRFLLMVRLFSHVRFRSKVVQIGTKWDKSGTLLDKISVHFDSPR